MGSNSNAGGDIERNAVGRIVVALLALRAPLPSPPTEPRLPNPVPMGTAQGIEIVGDRLELTARNASALMPPSDVAYRQLQVG
ncbi:MAG: hypothetical protein RLZ83_1025 [Pseudomonadota bacterium]|jgi:hypothetical protein